MSNYGADRRLCPVPRCGGMAFASSVDVGVGLYIGNDMACCRCDWEEGGPSDFGFIEMGDREFCPLPAGESA